MVRGLLGRVVGSRLRRVAPLLYRRVARSSLGGFFFSGFKASFGWPRDYVVEVDVQTSSPGVESFDLLQAHFHRLDLLVLYSGRARAKHCMVGPVYDRCCCKS